MSMPKNHKLGFHNINKTDKGERKYDALELEHLTVRVGHQLQISTRLKDYSPAHESNLIELGQEGQAIRNKYSGLGDFVSVC
jgi:hypothetical protein